MISYSLKISGWHESPLQELEATEFESIFEDSCEFIIGLFSSFTGIKFIEIFFLFSYFVKMYPAPGILFYFVQYFHL